MAAQYLSDPTAQQSVTKPLFTVFAGQARGRGKERTAAPLCRAARLCRAAWIVGPAMLKGEKHYGGQEMEEVTHAGDPGGDACHMHEPKA